MEQLTEIQEDDSKILVFYDIAHVEHQTKSTRNWQKKGNKYTKILKTISSKKRINILGALDREFNRFTIFITEDSCDKHLACFFLNK